MCYHRNFCILWSKVKALTMILQSIFLVTVNYLVALITLNLYTFKDYLAVWLSNSSGIPMKYEVSENINFKCSWYFNSLIFNYYFVITDVKSILNGYSLTLWRCNINSCNVEIYQKDHKIAYFGILSTIREISHRNNCHA